MTLPDGDKKAVLGVKTRQTRNGYIVVELEHYRAASTTQRETEHQVSTAMCTWYVDFRNTLPGKYRK